jgi:acetoin utilization deacetylase AcuC-like enzyme
MSLAVVTDNVFAAHNDPDHPESQARLEIALTGVPAQAHRIVPVQAALEDLARVHTPDYIAAIRSLCKQCRPERVCYLDPDTYLTARSFDAALYAAGAACQAADRALEGEHCFALVRPPGHHAMPNRAMGFCLFNNVAVAVARALREAGRIAIVDWDLHHGNGTQAAFYATDRVLYCSVHQMGIFPGTGWPEERGVGPGVGYTINAPLESGSTGADYTLIFSKVFLPALEEFDPDLLVVSAGQDASFDDPLGSMQLRPSDFGAMTGLLLESYGGALALVLEGGYGRSQGEAIRSICAALSGARIEPDGGEPKVSTRLLVEAYTDAVRVCPEEGNTAEGRIPL